MISITTESLEIKGMNKFVSQVLHMTKIRICIE